jgi:hypothetical protein
MRMNKIKKIIAIGFLGGVVSILALAVLEALTDIRFLHSAGGITAYVALFIPTIITGWVSTSISGE